jgi:hypothetical protein
MGWNNPTRLSIGGHFNVWRCPISGSRDRVVLGSLHDRAGRVRSVIAASPRAGSIGRAADCSLDLRIETGQWGG